MKKSDLKELIKPLVKECIHEVLVEEGHLASIVSEVAKGMQGNLVVESTRTPKKTPRRNEDIDMKKKAQESNRKLKEHRQKLMDSVGADAYNGVNLFEGTDPMTSYDVGEKPKGTVDLGPPGDAGVDIGSLVPAASQIWKAMK
tara:strand:+ start:13272 stop:13700 length:429 start_codon:yes stop_codon:yes gene_type:complete